MARIFIYICCICLLCSCDAKEDNRLRMEKVRSILSSGKYITFLIKNVDSKFNVTEEETNEHYFMFHVAKTENNIGYHVAVFLKTSNDSQYISFIEQYYIDTSEYRYEDAAKEYRYTVNKLGEIVDFSNCESASGCEIEEIWKIKFDLPHFHICGKQEPKESYNKRLKNIIDELYDILDVDD